MPATPIGSATRAPVFADSSGGRARQIRRCIPTCRMGRPEMAIRVFHRDTPSLKLPLISKDARFVVWPGEGAWTANMNYVRLEPGEANKPHVHTLSEDTIFILEGEGTIH